MATVRYLFASIISLLWLAPVGYAQRERTAPPENAPDLPDNRAAEAAKKAHAKDLVKFEKNADMLVLPGLLANRKEKWVRIYGKATGLNSKEPLEFFVTPFDSGKDYESMTAAFVTPSDVLRALVFIGMTPGRPVNYEKCQFWPKGERVFMTLEWADPANANNIINKRIEDMVIDARTSKSLPRAGFVFTGSYWIPAPGDGKPMFAADISDSRSIASDYNERSTVLDIPWQWAQGEVYGALKFNPQFRLSAGQPLQILLEPEHKEGKKRVRELSLLISMPAGKSGAQAGRYTLTDDQNKTVSDGDTLVHVLAAFGRITESGQDPFVTIRPDSQLTLQNVHDVYTLLKSMDTEDGIRIDSPPGGHLYYRAFFPKEDWRDRTKRLGRPWELHLANNPVGVVGELILPADDIDNNGGRGDLKFPVATADEMAKVLAEKSDRWSQSVYVFAAPTLKYGPMMDFIRPSMKTHSTMYVFLK